jgi:aminoglycoside phosphotransferase (APT) family kinase protein
MRHGDVGPWNAIFDGVRLVGFIDWDFAEPAPALWDLAQAAWYFVPLRPSELGWQAAGFLTEPDLCERLDVLCSAYGADVVDVLDALVALQQVELARTVELGAQGAWPWRHYLDRGDVEEIRSEAEWLATNRASLQ